MNLIQKIPIEIWDIIIAEFIIDDIIQMNLLLQNNHKLTLLTNLIKILIYEDYSFKLNDQDGRMCNILINESVIKKEKILRNIETFKDYFDNADRSNFINYLLNTVTNDTEVLLFEIYSTCYEIIELNKPHKELYNVKLCIHFNFISINEIISELTKNLTSLHEAYNIYLSLKKNYISLHIESLKDTILRLVDNKIIEICNCDNPFCYKFNIEYKNYSDYIDRFIFILLWNIKDSNSTIYRNIKYIFEYSSELNYIYLDKLTYFIM